MDLDSFFKPAVIGAVAAVIVNVAFQSVNGYLRWREGVNSEVRALIVRYIERAKATRRYLLVHLQGSPWEGL